MRDAPASVSLRKARRRRCQKAVPASRNDGRRAHRGPRAWNPQERRLHGARHDRRGADQGTERRFGTPAGGSHRVKSGRRIFRGFKAFRIVIVLQCVAP